MLFCSILIVVAALLVMLIVTLVGMILAVVATLAFFVLLGLFGLSGLDGSFVFHILVSEYRLLIIVLLKYFLIRSAHENFGR